MNILITGASGFIGKNLIAALMERRDLVLLEVGRHREEGRMDSYCREADFVFHLAGINRPVDESELGTRPEIIRLSAVIRKLDESEAVDHLLVHTGQNYDYELNAIAMAEKKPIIFSTHPRTRKQIEERKMEFNRILLSYTDYVHRVVWGVTK